MKKLFLLHALDLQMFADGAGGAGGGAAEGGAAGATAGDAGQQTTGVQTGSPAQEPGAAVAGQQAEDPAKAFEQLIKGQYKDQYNSRVEKTVTKRVAGLNQQLQRYKDAAPIFEILSQQYGVDATDLAGLAKAVQEDASFFQEEAIAKGMDVQDLMQMKRIQRENAQLQRQLEQQRTKEQADRQFQAWMQEAEAVKQYFPGFELETELQNDAFKRMLASGVPMKAAYTALHADEVVHSAMQFAAQKATQQVTDTVIAGAARPVENGAAGGGAAAPVLDVSKMSDKQIKEYAERARRGEKISFT